MRVFRTYARGPVVGVEGFGNGAVDCREGGVLVRRVLGRREGEGRKGRENEPKGRWIWTPLIRSFLVYRGTGILGDGCREDAQLGMGGCVMVALEVVLNQDSPSHASFLPERAYFSERGGEGNTLCYLICLTLVRCGPANRKRKHSLPVRKG